VETFGCSINNTWLLSLRWSDSLSLLRQYYLKILPLCFACYCQRPSIPCRFNSLYVVFEKKDANQKRVEEVKTLLFYFLACLPVRLHCRNDSERNNKTNPISEEKIQAFIKQFLLR